MSPEAAINLQNLSEMLVLLFCFALLMLQSDTSLLNYIAQSAAELQNKCDEMTPNSFANKIWISAVVCGKSPIKNSEYVLLQISGLLHLIVVSGSHLVIVEQLTEFATRPLKFKTIWKSTALVSFALITGFQPPVVRALLSSLIDEFQSNTKLFWNSPTVSFMSGLLALAIQPHWWDSVSLQLSWIAALALQFRPAEHLSRVKQQITIFLLMFPVLIQFTSPHPVSVIYNLVLAPLIGAILFPLSALAYLLPKIFFFADYGWDLLFASLKSTVPKAALPYSTFFLPNTVIWFYIFILNFYLVSRSNRLPYRPRIY